MRLKLMLGAGAAALVSLAVAAAAAPAVTAASAPAAAAPALGADPAVRSGTLSNGMRYEILRNATPPHNASLRLRIDAGSMYERDDQRGIAHFIEHMVFNGTTHVPEGEFVKRLERIGLAFGPDTNATTEFQQTVYMLDLPETDAQSLDTSLFLLREVASEVTFNAAAIDRERGIILSEERTRASPALRTALDEINYLARGDIIGARFPIGSTDVIKTAPRDRFVEYYNAYYRPERTTLIVVGDVDVDAVEAKIRASFSSWKGKGAPGAELPKPLVAPRSAEARVHVEAGLPNRVSIAWVTPPDLRADSLGLRRERIIEQLGLQILNRRFARLAASDNPPFIAGLAANADQAHRARVTQIVGIAQPGKWQLALAAVEQEQRRALDRGFSQAELDREVSEARAALTAAANGAATRPTPALAQTLVAHADDKKVFTSPADNLALFEA